MDFQIKILGGVIARQRLKVTTYSLYLARIII
jgi:hypothetical protein